MSAGVSNLVDKILSRPLEVSCLEIMQSAFQCQRCGSCCTKMNGIGVTDKDISRLAKHMGHGPKWFKENYTEKDIDNALLLLKGTLSNKAEGRCPFYDDGCTVYKHRSTVCRMFPLLNYTDGKLEPHLYEDCPGVVALIKEIKEIKEYKEENDSPPQLDEKNVAELQLIAHVNIMKDLSGLYNRRQYNELMKMTPRWDKVNRLFVINFLARVISWEEINGFFSRIETSTESNK